MRVVGYCRFSSEGQRDGYSIEAQKEAITGYCDVNGYTLLRFYVDEAQTGTDDERESFLDMIDATKSGEIDAIIVHKLDRFARNRYDSAIYGRILEEREVALFSVCEPIIADNTPESLLFRGVVETINEYYSRNLARETLKGQTIAAKDARYLGGYVPFGYSLDKTKHFVVNPTEAPIVLEIFKRIDAGQTAIEVARWIKTQNVLTRYGKEFTASSVMAMCKNPIYIGRYTWGTASKRKNFTPITLDDAIEPIVPRELFDRVNELIANRARGPLKRYKGQDYLLTGYLYCEYCGSHLYGFKSMCRYKTAKGEPREYVKYKYRCAHDSHSSQIRKTDKNYVKPHCTLRMLPKDELEGLVGEAIRRDIFSDNAVEYIATALRERLTTQVPGSPDAIKKVEAQLRANSVKMQRLLDLYLDGSLDKATYNAKYRELSELAKAYSTELSRLQAPQFEVSVETIKNAIAKYSDSVSASSAEATKMLISTFVDHIDVSNEHIVIYYKLEFIGLPECSTFPFVRNRKSALPQFLLRTEFFYTPSDGRNAHKFNIRRGGTTIVSAAEFQRLAA